MSAGTKHTAADRSARVRARAVYFEWLAKTGDIAEAARRAGVSVRTGRRWRQREHTADLRTAVGDGPPTATRMTPSRGRAEEIVALDSALQAAPIATIIGAPGVGKTRLARDYSLLWAAESGPKSVTWCYLAECSTQDQLLLALARAVGVGGGQQPDLLAVMGRAIAARGRHLWILDNAEQLVHVLSGPLSRWQIDEPEARWILTSRVAGAAPGERAIRLAPLALPDAEAPWEDAAATPAVAMFLDHVRLARPDFEPGPQDQRAIREIARRVDGIPLAIELAAARVRALSPAALTATLPRALHLSATPGDADVSARWRSLEAAVAWSWNMLGPGLQAVLAQLTVFAGGFTQAAAEAVVMRGPGDSTPIGTALERLHDHSLLYATARPNRPLRYFLFEAVRELAARRATATVTNAARRRHASYFATAMGMAAEERLRSLDDARTLAAEADNLLAAHRWALTEAPMSAEVATSAVEVVLALEPLLASRGPAPMHAALLDATADHTAAADVAPALRARLAMARSRMWVNAGDLTRAGACLELARADASESGDRRIAGRAIAHSAWLDVLRGQRETGRDTAARALAIHRETGDRYAEGTTLRLLGMAAAWAGDAGTARRYLESALSAQRAAGDRVGMAESLSELAEFAHAPHQYDIARAFYAAALATFREMGARRAEGYALGNLALLEQEAGRVRASKARYREALAALRDTGTRVLEGVYTGLMGTLQHERGQLRAAIASYTEAVQITEGLEAHRYVSFFVACRTLAEVTGSRRRRRPSNAKRAAPGTAAPAIAVAENEAVANKTIDPVIQTALELLAAATRAVPGEAVAIAACREAIAAARERVELIEVRIAIRLAQAALRVAGAADAERDPASAAPASSTRVWFDGQRFRTARGIAVDLSRRAALRRMAQRLVDERIREPGRALPLDTLIACAWPGERMRPDSARNRGHVALNTLRDLGLRDLLLRSDEGYYLDPKVEVQLAGAPRAPA